MLSELRQILLLKWVLPIQEKSLYVSSDLPGLLIIMDIGGGSVKRKKRRREKGLIKRSQWRKMCQYPLPSLSPLSILRCFHASFSLRAGRNPKFYGDEKFSSSSSPPHQKRGLILFSHSLSSLLPLNSNIFSSGKILPSLGFGGLFVRNQCHSIIPVTVDRRVAPAPNPAPAPVYLKFKSRVRRRCRILEHAVSP